MKKFYISVDTHQQFETFDLYDNAVWVAYLKLLKSIQDKGVQLAFKENGNSMDFNIGDDFKVNH